MDNLEMNSKSVNTNATIEEAAAVSEEVVISERALIRSEVEEDEEVDDAEANEDLSLKMVEKAMVRACTSVTGLDEEGEVLTNMIGESKNCDNKEKKKDQIVAAKADHADRPKKEESMDATKSMKIVDSVAEKNPVEISNNAVLQKLLRGPRYFDPPNSSWGTCYNCGEEGHAAVNCTSAKRKKPCFVCGSFEHNAKQCVKSKDCFICKKGGHRAKDCSERNQGGLQSSKTCLNCGHSGHDMFSCSNNYSADDLKEIQCYVCKSFGHLCCASYPDSGPREVSCYRCGLLGHTGLACVGSRGETGRSLSSCFRCGEEGHFARECTNPNKVSKQNRELSTPKKKVRRERKERYEFRSAPPDHGKARNKKAQSEGGYASGYKIKQRCGWITEDPEDFPQPNNWGSPSTPRSKRAKISNFSRGGHASGSHSSRKSNKLDFNDSASYGSGRYHHQLDFNDSASYGSGRYHHRLDFNASTSYESGKYHHHSFSESRFGNSSQNGWRRNYDW